MRGLFYRKGGEFLVFHSRKPDLSNLGWTDSSRVCPLAEQTLMCSLIHLNN
ncbi:hypothetical protein HMPREF9104_02111 [Lentilactobacillus kisonensis F0435]|uniref:Uncharacterized protein n=1 Tax=Lentilactobacillus kisonensis F0435 TaxID=797516 RepID=H1LHM0_9LACO|nr:hypothetical protein HMPREF9104_02111 [Lentilactobacillus kisonensis F0435]